MQTWMGESESAICGRRRIQWVGWGNYDADRLLILANIQHPL